MRVRFAVLLALTLTGVFADVNNAAVLSAATPSVSTPLGGNDHILDRIASALVTYGKESSYAKDKGDDMRAWGPRALNLVIVAIFVAVFWTRLYQHKREAHPKPIRTQWNYYIGFFCALFMIILAVVGGVICVLASTGTIGTRFIDLPRFVPCNCDPSQSSCNCDTLASGEHVYNTHDYSFSAALDSEWYMNFAGALPTIFTGLIALAELFGRSTLRARRANIALLVHIFMGLTMTFSISAIPTKYYGEWIHLGCAMLMVVFSICHVWAQYSTAMGYDSLKDFAHGLKWPAIVTTIAGPAAMAGIVTLSTHKQNWLIPLLEMIFIVSYNVVVATYFKKTS